MQFVINGVLYVLHRRQRVAEATLIEDGKAAANGGGGKGWAAADLRSAEQNGQTGGATSNV